MRARGSSFQPGFFHLVTLPCTRRCTAHPGFTVDCRPLRFQLTLRLWRSWQESAHTGRAPSFSAQPLKDTHNTLRAPTPGWSSKCVLGFLRTLSRSCVRQLAHVQSPLGRLTQNPRQGRAPRSSTGTLILVSTTVLLGYTVFISEELSLDIKLSKQYLYLRLPRKIT